MLKIKTISIIAVLCMVVCTCTYLTKETTSQNKTYKIGDRGPAGGWIFYDKGNYSDGWRYLEAAPENQGKAKWGCYKKSIPGARGTAIGTGKSNTQAIINGCNEPGIAAKLCSEYRGGGKSDWFLPSKDELKLMYNNLKRRRIGDFAGDNYWSSSEVNDKNAWVEYFMTGIQLDELAKVLKTWVRAARAF